VLGLRAGVGSPSGFRSYGTGRSVNSNGTSTRTRVTGDRDIREVGAEPGWRSMGTDPEYFIRGAGGRVAAGRAAQGTAPESPPAGATANSPNWSGVRPGSPACPMSAIGPAVWARPP